MKRYCATQAGVEEWEVLANATSQEVSFSDGKCRRENSGDQLCRHVHIFIFIKQKLIRITDCCCSPAPARFGFYSQEYNAKEGRTGGLRTPSFVSRLCQTCWGYVYSNCLAQVWAYSMFMHCLFGQLTFLAGLWHPLVKSEALLGWSSEGRHIWLGLGQECLAEATCQGLGCCCCHYDASQWGTFSACLWCEVKIKPFQWRNKQPWHHLSLWLQVTHAQVLAWGDLVGWNVAGWDAPGDRLSSQLGHGTGCINSALLSLFSVRCDSLKQL